MKSLLTFITLLIVSFSTTAGMRQVSLDAPSTFTNPKSYIHKAPLGIPLESVIDALGVPTNSTEVGESTYMSYELGRGWGKRQFIFIIKDNILIKVQYKDANNSLEKSIN